MVGISVWPPASSLASLAGRQQLGGVGDRLRAMIVESVHGSSPPYSAAILVGDFWAALHTACGVAGMAISSWPSASVMALMTAGGRGDGAGLAAALDAQRVRRAGRAGHGHVEGRQVAGARHAVVHVAGGDQLAFLVVDRAFQQRLADALGDAAVHLALDDHRIDERAEVVDRGPAVDAGDAGLGVDLHLADVHARGEGEVGRIEEGAFLQARLELLRR